MDRLPRIELGGAEFKADRRAAYRRLRREAPVALTTMNGATAVLLMRHHEVSAVLRNASSVVNAPGGRILPHLGSGSAARHYASSLPSVDGSQHEHLRGAVGRIFSPSGVLRFETVVTDIIDQCLRDVAEASEIEVMSQIGHSIAIGVACHLLHIPIDDGNRLLEKVNDILLIFDGEVTAEMLPRMNETVDDYYGYFSAVLDRGAVLPADDLLGAAHRALTAGAIDRNGALALLVTVFTGNYHTTMVSLTNAVKALCLHPDQHAILRDDPSLGGKAWDEALRMDPPVHFRHRFAGEDIHIDGHVIPAGTKLILALASANWDEHAFPDPDRFDIRRQAKAHVSFGGGAHFCLGAQLSRLEGKIFLPSLLRHLRDFAPGPKRYPDFDDIAFPAPTGFSMLVRNVRQAEPA